VLGLVRDVLTTHVLGVNWVSGTFVLAWMLPNMLRRLFGEGALAASFVPAFTRRLTRDDTDGARNLLASVTGVVTTVLGTTVLAVVAIALFVPPAAWGLAPVDGATSAERGRLLTDLLVSLFPYALPICLVAIYAGAGHALGIFAPSAAAPAVLNVFWIAALVFVAVTGADDLSRAVRIIAITLLVGGFAQLALTCVPLARRQALPRPRWPQAGDGARDVFRAMGPTVLGLSLVQVNLLVDQGIAFGLIGPESNNHIFLANRLLLFPHALVALPLATAVFPRLAAEASRENYASLRQNLDRAISVTLFFALPAAAGLSVVASELIHVAFVHGRYTAADGVTTAWTTIALVLGLPALGIAQLEARALYALGRTREPAVIAGVLVVVNLALNLFLVLVVDLGVAGLTTATSCCTAINAWALGRAVRRHAGPGSLHGSSWLRLAGTTAVMVLVLLLLPTPSPDSNRLEHLLLGIVVPIAAGVLVYGGLHVLLRSPEWRAVVERFRSRRGHSMRSNSM
jgi:putative peptidoglycan lipid II flippase